MFAVGAAVVFLIAVLSLVLPESMPTALSPQHGLIVTVESAGAGEPEVIEMELEIPAGLWIAADDPAVARTRIVRWRERVGSEGFERKIGLFAARVGDCSVVLRARKDERWTTVQLPLRVSATELVVGQPVLTMVVPKGTESVLVSLSLSVAGGPHPDV